MSLKDLTKDHHQDAERQEFVKVLMGGDIDPQMYARYLYNQFPCYELLEVLAGVQGIFQDLEDLPRRKAIIEDFRELWPADKDTPTPCPVVKEYLDHLMSIKDDKHKLMAHVYVRHMGDLSGGQMIAKKVPGEGRFYKFENSDKLKENIRKKIDDSMADEAKLCFEYATRLFKELMPYVNK